MIQRCVQKSHCIHIHPKPHTRNIFYYRFFPHREVYERERGSKREWAFNRELYKSSYECYLLVFTMGSDAECTFESGAKCFLPSLRFQRRAYRSKEASYIINDAWEARAKREGKKFQCSLDIFIIITYFLYFPLLMCSIERPSCSHSLEMLIKFAPAIYVCVCCAHVYTREWRRRKMRDVWQENSILWLKERDNW